MLKVDEKRTNWTTLMYKGGIECEGSPCSQIPSHVVISHYLSFNLGHSWTCTPLVFISLTFFHAFFLFYKFQSSYVQGKETHTFHLLTTKTLAMTLLCPVIKFGYRMYHYYLLQKIVIFKTFFKSILFGILSCWMFNYWTQDCNQSSRKPQHQK
jgi:hypothetical protein